MKQKDKIFKQKEQKKAIPGYQLIGSPAVTRVIIVRQSSRQNGFYEEANKKALTTITLSGLQKNFSATSYSPTKLPWQYHRRYRA